MQVVLFDVDHTLMASPKGANARSSRVMFKQVFGIDASEDEVEKVGKTEWGLIEQVLQDKGAAQALIDEAQHRIPEQAYKVWADALDAEMQEKPSMIYPGMWDMLVALSDVTDIKLGLLTGNSIWRSEVKLRAIGVDEFFRDRMGKLIGSFGNESKTREGLIAFAQDRLVFDHDSLSIIDDSLIGAKMLADKDIPAIFVATGSASYQELKQYQQHVFPDLGEDRWKQAYQFLLSCSIDKSQ